MKAMGNYPRPSELDRLIDSYEGREQGTQSYNPNVWVAALADVVDEDFVRRALQRRDVTTELRPDRFGVDRERLAKVVAGTDLDDDGELLSAWLLVQAWGNGVSSRFGRLNTAKAVGHREQLLTNLRTTTAILREAQEPVEIEKAYRAWQGRIGISEAFFTKWFAFAGVRAGREWQPLILDARVRRTLARRPLDVSVTAVAGTTSLWVVYRAYIEMVHEWGGSPEGAQRLEWILFEHNGRGLDE